MSGFSRERRGMLLPLLSLPLTKPCQELYTSLGNGHFNQAVDEQHGHVRHPCLLYPRPACTQHDHMRVGCCHCRLSTFSSGSAPAEVSGKRSDHFGVVFSAFSDHNPSEAVEPLAQASTTKRSMLLARTLQRKPAPLLSHVLAEVRSSAAVVVGAGKQLPGP